MAENGDTVTVSKRSIKIAIGVLLAIGALVAIAVLATDNGDSEKDKGTGTPSASTPASEAQDVTTNPGIRSEPPSVDPSQWNTIWCQASVGLSRNELWQLMGEPTEPDSGLIPHIPINGKEPPAPNGSDTWEASGTYQFNAFYATDLTVQQLDFGGPDNQIDCSDTRT